MDSEQFDLYLFQHQSTAVCANVWATVCHDSLHVPLNINKPNLKIQVS